MTPEPALEAEKKTSKRARKVDPAVPGESTVAVALIPAPGDPQAYGAYLNFLGLVARGSSSQQAVHDDIDPNEKALLEIVLLRWAQKSPMTVRQTIALAHLGSPATLHKRLMRLRARSYLQLQDVAGDRRVKQLVAGVRAIEYLQTMGRCMLDAGRVIRKASKAA